MIICKHCNNNKIWLAGFSSNGKKRYKCSNCKKTFSIEEDKRVKHGLAERRFCIINYLNGMSMRGIQSMLNDMFNKKIHFKNIDHWIKNADKILKEELEERRKADKSKGVEILEIDNISEYIKKNPKIIQEKNIFIKEYNIFIIGIKIE